MKQEDLLLHKEHSGKQRSISFPEKIEIDGDKLIYLYCIDDIEEY